MGLIQSLFSDPLWFLEYSLFRIPALLIALTVHELAHGYVAYRCGDNTAKMMGRLSFNPLKHLDPVGAVMMLLFGFGWAKPVPVNPRHFRNHRRDDIMVSLAGIAANLMLFLLCTGVAVGLNGLLWQKDVLQYNTTSELLGFNNGVIYGIMGYGIKGMEPYIASPALVPVMRFVMFLAQINLGLALFNILPVPPLDGFHVVNDILLGGQFNFSTRSVQGSMGILMLLSFTGWLSKYMTFTMDGLQAGVLWLCSQVIGR